MSCVLHFVHVCHEVARRSMGEKSKESTWSTRCEFLSELVLLLQLVNPPLIYVLRGHANHGRFCPS